MGNRENSLRKFCIPSIIPASGPGINPNAISAQPIKKMVMICLWYMGSHPNVARTLVWDVIRPPYVELIPFDVNRAARYTKIRATNAVTPADAIHLASAAESRVNLFLTNDHRLQSLIIPGIDFIAGLDVNLF